MDSGRYMAVSVGVLNPAALDQSYVRGHVQIRLPGMVEISAMEVVSRLWNAIQIFALVT